MHPGPELDAVIAKKILKAVVVFDKVRGASYMLEGDHRTPLPAFSTDTDAAKSLSVVLERDGWRMRTKKADGSVIVGFVRKDGGVYRHYHAETLPFAICVAALAVHDGTNIQSI